ncbi:hypothetical protein [Nocardiopsis alborubida]|uniref:Single-stranded DNA-binding protein n=1 Tax=Nocardiopsis alborubida TaxID=146802 RepID=A0A7X6M8W7_9ACTN|nr:hypothetical protein [Nocardiopsis alborubida]NKY96599.1 hypothetical protein [Nocardiopsis alborubida]
MTNPNNFGHATVRLAADPVAFSNANGSKNIKFSGYMDNNFKSRDGNWGSQKVPFETYIRETTDATKTPFAAMREGDIVNIAYHLEDGSYRDKKTGQMVYAGPKVIVDDIWFVEPKSIREARAQAKASRNQAPAQSAPSAAPQQPQPVVAQPAQTVQQTPVAVPAQAQPQPAAGQPMAVPARVAQAQGNAIVNELPY